MANTAYKIPEGWRQTTIGEVAKVLSGATPKTSSPEYWNGNVVWITPKDLSALGSRFITDSERKLTPAGLESCSAVMVPVNSLVMSSRAPIGYLAINSVPLASNQGCKSIVPSDSVNVEYLYYYLTSNIEDVKRLGTGSTFAEVGKSAVEGVRVVLPPVSEQGNIASILNIVDQELQKTEEIISSSEKLKRGVMQELLTRGVGHNEFKETEVGNIPKAWFTSKLGDLATITRGGSPRPIEEFITTDEDGLNWLKIGDIKPGAKYITRTSQKIKRSGLSKTTQVHEGDFILSNSMSFGRPYIMKMDACIHDGWLAFKQIKTDLVSSEFLYYLLSSRILQNAFWAIAAGSGVKNLKRESVSNVVVALPSVSEQQKIAEILSALDKKVLVNRAIKEKLTHLKKGLMNDLLSGKKRTV